MAIRNSLSKSERTALAKKLAKLFAEISHKNDFMMNYHARYQMPIKVVRKNHVRYKKILAACDLLISLELNV